MLIFLPCLISSPSKEGQSLEQSHTLSCSQSTAGHWAGSPIPAPNPWVALIPCLSAEVKLHCSIPLLITCWPRGVPQRTGMDFSARVDHGALFDKREGVNIFWQHLCTEDAASVAVPAQMSAAEDFPCFPHRVAIVGLSWHPEHLGFSSCLPSIRHSSAFLPQKMCVSSSSQHPVRKGHAALSA